MRKSKQLFLFSVLLIAITTASAQAQMKAGGGVIFGSGIEQVGVQGDIHYQFAAIPALELGGGFAYYFPKNNQDFYEINVNGVYAYYEQFMFRSYLYSGLNYARSKVNAGGVSVSESAADPIAAKSELYNR